MILGYLEQQDPNEAKNFIMHNVGAASVNISKVTKEIESTGIAAIIIGKMVEAGSCGIKLELQADSYCKNLTEGVSFDCYVTVLGNLLQNAIDELRQSDTPVKEISLGLFIDERYTILTVTDTGRGAAVLPAARPVLIDAAGLSEDTPAGSALLQAGAKKFWKSTCKLYRNRIYL